VAREAHLRQAHANLAQAQRLLATSTGDPTAMQWVVTAAFYCAVHCIEAHLAAQVQLPPQKRHSRTHRQRQVVMADPGAGIPPDVYAAYRMLKWRSEGARYLLQQFTLRRVREEILGTCLPRVAQLASL
jgi:hypothetical protein